MLNYKQAERILISESQKFWNDTQNPRYENEAHWRGHGIFRDEEIWYKLGATFDRLHDKAVFHSSSVPTSVDCIVEWGSGGGMIAVALSKKTNRYIGVDVNRKNLDECERQLKQVDFRSFEPILIPVENPEKAIDSIKVSCDLFICGYVFELMPSEAYAMRILAIAHRLMRKGGIAIINIRYSNCSIRYRSRGWNYKENFARITTWRVEEFWIKTDKIGFKPLFVELVPTLPELNEQNYAFFALMKV